MPNEDGVLTTQKLIEASRKIATLPSGDRIVIRRVGPAVLLRATGNIPDIASLAASKGGDNLDPVRAASVVPLIEKVLLAGIVEPTLQADPLQGATPGDFTWKDQLAAFTAILEHSGYSKREGDEVLPFARTTN